MSKEWMNQTWRHSSYDSDLSTQASVIVRVANDNLNLRGIPILKQKNIWTTEATNPANSN